MLIRRDHNHDHRLNVVFFLSYPSKCPTAGKTPPHSPSKSLYFGQTLAMITKRKKRTTDTNIKKNISTKIKKHKPQIRAFVNN